MVKMTITTLVVGLLFAACGPAQEPLASTSTQITDEMIGSRFPAMQLSGRAATESYGYTPETPVLIGGGFSEGSGRTYSYLNALLGPNGQKVHYERWGTCCSFKTPNSPFGDEALLEVFEISYEGLDEPRKLYFNWYDAKDPRVPSGLDSAGVARAKP